MFNPTVQLKSGGYIVIGVTEALVAIDVNSGRSTREHSIEETALKTNLEAADEVARQLRLRDLAGLIVIDFIDMEDSRNNRAVEKRFKDRLKVDRARIQVGRISAFGLMEMSRQRLRPGMLEATTQACPHCQGTGIIRSDESLALSILREIEEEGVRGRSAECTATVPVEIANYIINHKRDHVAQIESRSGMRVLIIGDALTRSPDFELERAKTSTLPPPVRSAAPVTALTVAADAAEEMVEADDVFEAEEVAEAVPEAAPEKESAEDGERRRRRGKRGGRRRRRGGDRKDEGEGEGTEQEAEGTEDAEAAEAMPAPSGSESHIAEAAETPEAKDAPESPEAEAEAGTKRRRPRRRTGPRHHPAAAEALEVVEIAVDDPRTAGDGELLVAEAPTDPEAIATPEAATAQQTESVAAEVVLAQPSEPVPEPEPAPEAEPELEPEPAVAEDVAAAEAAAEPGPDAPPSEQREPEDAKPEDPQRPKRRGWWSFSR